MLKKQILLCVALISMALANVANAALIYASSAPSVTVGTGQGTANNRDDINNLFGATDGSFYELGLGGIVDLQFGSPTGQLFSTSGLITEVTFGNFSQWEESVDIYAGFEGTFSFVASVVNTGAQNGAQFILTGIFDTIRLVDTTASLNTNSVGGFDVDSVAVMQATSTVEVPAPVTIFLVLTTAVVLFVRKRLS